MKIYLVSNNLLLDGISYDNNASLEQIRMIRPLSVKGEEVAKKIGNIPFFKNVENIYTSFYSSALDTAKYLAKNLDLSITLNENLNDCQVGILGSKNMKMVKGLQDHDFNYKLPSGESLNEVGRRMENFINLISEECVIFTHKRAILGFLLNYAKVGYNLYDDLILEFNGHIIYDESETEFDIYELTIENSRVTSIIRL